MEGKRFMTTHIYIIFLKEMSIFSCIRKKFILKYPREVVIIGEKEEEYTGIRGGQIHSTEALYPMEGVSHLKPLNLLKILFV